MRGSAEWPEGDTMPDEDFDAYLRYLARERVEPRLPRLRRLFPASINEVGSTLDGLRHAHQALNYIQDSMGDDTEIYGTFTRDTLAGIIDEAQSGVYLNNSLADESGVMEVMDEHFADLASGLRADHLLPWEEEILTRLGFPRVAANLPNLVYETRLLAQRQRRDLGEVRVSQRLRELDHILQQVAHEHRQPANPSPEPKSRKWWTGLGKVVAGSVSSIIDIATGAGLLAVGAPPEMNTVLASTIMGCGALMEAMGAFRGE
jgi:hypothetical protein